MPLCLLRMRKFRVSLFSLIFSFMDVILVLLSLSLSHLEFISILVIPIIPLNILISPTFILSFCFFIKDQHSALYIMINPIHVRPEFSFRSLNKVLRYTSISHLKIMWQILPFNLRKHNIDSKVLIQCVMQPLHFITAK